MNLEDRVTVLLTKEEAALFALFMQHYDNIGFLIAKDVLTLRSSNAILSFDGKGLIKTVKKELFEYR